MRERWTTTFITNLCVVRDWEVTRKLAEEHTPET
jgi:hypothetical protein